MREREKEKDREKTMACVTTASRREASKWIYDIFPASPLARYSRGLKTTSMQRRCAFDVAFLTRPTHDASLFLTRVPCLGSLNKSSSSLCAFVRSCAD